MQPNMTSTCAPHRHPPRRFGLRRFLTMVALHRQRRHLAALDAAALRDLGLTKSDVKSEVSRLIWDVPGHWHK